MKIRLNKRKLFSVIAGLIIHVSLANTTTPPDTTQLDSSIRYGKLPNGLSYYIKPLDNPNAGLNLRLVVKAGFFQEGPGETEFAHIVEHLGFSAGRKYSTKGNSSLYDKAGIGLADLNGLTADDYTDYFLQTSKENPLGMEIAFKLFQDILWNLDFTNKNIDLERSTVLGEADGGNFGLGNYIYHMEKQITGWGSSPPKDYANHLKTFKPEKIRNFYKKWYRPDLMAIVVIGDIDNVDQIEKKLKEKFSEGKVPGNPPNPTINTSDYLKKSPQFRKTVLQNKNNNHLEYKPTLIRLYFRLFENKNKKTIQGLKDQVVRGLFIELLNKRYQQVLQKYNTFLAIRPKFLEPPAALRIEVSPKQGIKKDAIYNTIKILKQIKEYGFTAREFSDGKKEYLRLMRKSDTLGIYYWKNQINEHFVNGEPLPERKPQILEKILKDLSEEEYNAEIKKYLKEEPDDISIAGYEKSPGLDKVEKKIRSWIKEVNRNPVDSLTVSQNHLVLMDPSEMKKLEISPVKALQTDIPGAKSFQLKNGLRVILKSSVAEYYQSSIVMRGFSSRGIDCFSKDDYFSVINAPSILRNSGVGDLDKFDLKRYLNRKEFDGYVLTFVESDASGLKGNFTLKDLETALQLMYLYFTSPNFSINAFEDWKTQQKINVAFKNFPAENFETAIREILPDRDFTPKGQKFIEGLEQINLDRVREIYMHLFRDPGNFTFLFSGDFNEEEVLRLCQKYLGNLPAKPNTSNCIRESKDSKMKPLKSRTFYANAPLELAMVRIAYIKKLNSAILDWKEEIKLNILRRILAESLIRRLRFESEEDGTYQVLAIRDHSSYYKYHGMYLDFNAYPKDTERLIEDSEVVVENLKKKPVEVSLFENVRKMQLNQFNTHGKIMQKMYGVVKKGEPWIAEEEKNAFLESLNPQDIQATAVKYLKNKPVVFQMLPRK